MSGHSLEGRVLKRPGSPGPVRRRTPDRRLSFRSLQAARIRTAVARIFFDLRDAGEDLPRRFRQLELAPEEGAADRPPMDVLETDAFLSTADHPSGRRQLDPGETVPALAEGRGFREPPTPLRESPVDRGFPFVAVARIEVGGGRLTMPFRRREAARAGRSLPEAAPPCQRCFRLATPENAA